MRIAINGYGRIGRCVLRACFERKDTADLSIVSINELADHEAISYLTKFDSTHGLFPGSVDYKASDDSTCSQLLINNEKIDLYNIKKIADLPWSEQNIDILLECTGTITSKKIASKHNLAGAKKVILSNPGESDIPAIVFGVNHQQDICKELIISAASCTSNALIPVLSTLDKLFGIENGVITTIHASMHDQPVIDAYHSKDLRRNRAASQSIIPVDTALAEGIGRVLPKLSGKFVAQALRVPVNNVSALNLTANLSTPVTLENINSCLQEASDQDLEGVLGYTNEPLASCDFNHDFHSGIVDANQTRVSNGNTINILIWFDNEWAFANRMIDIALYLKSLD